jgi:hypothetical protein
MKIRVLPVLVALLTGIACLYPIPAHSRPLPIRTQGFGLPGSLGDVATVICVPKRGRCSGDFATVNLPKNTKHLMVWVTQDGQWDVSNRIRFDIKMDRKNWWDKTWKKKVTNADSIDRSAHPRRWVEIPTNERLLPGKQPGFWVDPMEHRKLFISNARGAGGRSFVVVLEAYSRDPR